VHSIDSNWPGRPSSAETSETTRATLPFSPLTSLLLTLRMVSVHRKSGGEESAEEQGRTPHSSGQDELMVSSVKLRNNYMPKCPYAQLVTNLNVCNLYPSSAQQ